MIQPSFPENNIVDSGSNGSGADSSEKRQAWSHHRRQWRGDDGRCQLFLLGREALLSDWHKSLSQS